MEEKCLFSKESFYFELTFMLVGIDVSELDVVDDSVVKE